MLFLVRSDRGGCQQHSVRGQQEAVMRYQNLLLVGMFAPYLTCFNLE